MAADTPSPAPETLEATESGRRPRKWTLLLFPDGFRGERQDDAASFHVLRTKLADLVDLKLGREC